VRTTTSASSGEVSGNGFTDVVELSLEDRGFFGCGVDWRRFASVGKKFLNHFGRQEIFLVNQCVTHQVTRDTVAFCKEGKVDKNCQNDDDKSSENFTHLL
jgi:hypothetical protein